MVGTIVPIGYGERRQGRLPPAHWLHALGNIVGAAGLGGLLGKLGAALPWHMTLAADTMVVLLVVGGFSLLYSLRELQLAPVPAPQLMWQVPVWWQGRMARWLVAVLYGLVLGGGLATRVAVTTFYVPALWSVLVGDAGRGALVMGAFGLGRSLPVLWFGIRGRSAEETLPLIGALRAWQPMVHLVNGLVLGLAGTALVIAGLSSVW